MADNEIATLTSLKDTVSERIRAQFVALIPDDVWKKMVDAEIKWMLTPIEHHNGNREYYSPLQDMIRDELTKIMRAQLIKELENPQWVGSYTNQPMPFHAGPSEAIRAIIKDLIPEIITAHYGTMFQNSLTMIKSSLQSQGRTW